MHGKGMLKSEAGIYSGDFVTHRIEGSGRYDFADGSVYIGEFKNNFFDGKGVLGCNSTTFLSSHDLACHEY